MNNMLKKCLILTMVIAMVLTMCAAFGFAESTPSPTGKLVVVSYSIDGNPSRITKGQTVDVTLHLKHTTQSASGLNGNITIDRMADSFSGGTVKVTEINFTNNSGHTEPYSIWRSDNLSLGSQTVTVK